MVDGSKDCVPSWGGKGRVREVEPLGFSGRFRPLWNCARRYRVGRFDAQTREVFSKKYGSFGHGYRMEIWRIW
jgi:hypothetical protein